MPLACFCAIGPLSRRASSRIVTFTMSALAITWGLSVFGLFGDEMAQPGIAVFVVMGVLLVGAAVAIATTLDVVWDRLTLALSERGRGLSLRLAFAYPLARRFRTGMILAMFSLIIFSMTFMAAFSAILSSGQADAVRDIRAGFDLMVDSNRSNPITSDELEARPEVRDATTLLRSAPEMTMRYQPEPTRWSLTGFDATLPRPRRAPTSSTVTATTPPTGPRSRRSSPIRTWRSSARSSSRTAPPRPATVPGWATPCR